MRNYATQMDAAKRGIVTPEIETVARKENRPVEFIMEQVIGTIAIPANISAKPVRGGDRRGTRVKIPACATFPRQTLWLMFAESQSYAATFVPY